MSTPTIAHELAAFAADARRSLPDAVSADVVGRITDVIGNSLAALEARGPAEPHNALLRLMRRRGGSEEAGVVGGGRRLPASAAALVNGTLAHALDFDDTHLPSVLHPSASVVPAALAVAEAEGRTGAELLAAVAVGNEICNRLGMASYIPELRNSTFFEKGLHATSICGTVGAAASTAMLLGLDEAGISSAMGIAASMGAGIIEANRTGGTVKHVHCGWAAHAAVEAGLFAAEGVTGPPTVFEGRFGFLRAHLGDDHDASAVTEGLGDRWELLRTVYKPYPSNHFTHPAIDCALALRAEGLDPEHIESIELGVAAAPLRTIGEPRAEKIRPRSAYHAKFSGPYTVAAALHGGGGLGVHLDDFTEEALADPARRALTEKVTVVADPVCDDEFPNAFSAVLRVRTTDGRTLEHRRHSSRGGPEFPLTAGELALKFELNAGRVLTPAEATAVRDRIRALPGAPRVESLTG
ncbi:MmgE/PrpD family protein [Streptomyces sp. NBC_01754]|uniref:MmgE/PrpD family protein n=1 Tax=Streptomyces sp. NBC_01754 TaxID=2975930 RepID=UPI002DDBC095|nr:MmgE/PrpD family protein [Streptomyces sp. NBC_01754]WSC91837.1 MmgE/PrpD family protein [Streptomyces sp. NBC_01754]